MQIRNSAARFPPGPTGSLLYLVSGSTPPAGFTFIGTLQQRLAGSGGSVAVNVYRKD